MQVEDRRRQRTCGSVAPSRPIRGADAVGNLSIQRTLGTRENMHAKGEARAGVKREMHYRPVGTLRQWIAALAAGRWPLRSARAIYISPLGSEWLRRLELESAKHRKDGR
jgi:hypothetical protein